MFERSHAQCLTLFIGAMEVVAKEKGVDNLIIKAALALVNIGAHNPSMVDDSLNALYDLAGVDSGTPIDLSSFPEPEYS